MVKLDKKRESVNVRMDHLREVEGKRAHDPFEEEGRMMKEGGLGSRCVYVPGPLIVGAGPSGLAASACLKVRGIPSVILERANCIASLWQLKTYDRLHLHLPKQFCQLPLMPFPDCFPTYPTKQQFIAYLEAYAKRFQLQPSFNETVKSAEYDKKLEFWRVRTVGLKSEETEYVCKWLVVATGENAEEVWPQIDGITDFIGDIMHTSSYKSGDSFKGKKVLVVGCGNSGMEVCLDLCNNGANPSLVVRDTVHVLPREMLGSSTFGLSMWLLKWLPVQMVDRFLLLLSWLIIGDTSRLGLDRPQVGPIELKNLSGKTPVLDVGTLAKIRAGEIKVYPAIKRLTKHGAEFVDERFGTFDAIIIATGYKSNVPSWLKERGFFDTKDGLPRKPFPHGWKGDCGLYAVGFTKRGLLGASMDASRIAQDIKNCWKPKISNSKASLAHPHKRKNGERHMQYGPS